MKILVDDCVFSHASRLERVRDTRTMDWGGVSHKWITTALQAKKPTEPAWLRDQIESLPHIAIVR